MRLNEFLSEAPITDFDYVDMGTEADPALTFTAPEKKSLTSERGQQRYFNAFKKTPFNIKVTIVNNTIADATSGTDNYQVQNLVSHHEVRAGIHDNYTFYDNGDEIEIDGEAGVIKIVLLANLSPLDDRMPMTPWILAHKIGHSFQDQSYASGWKDQGMTDLVVELNKILQKIGSHVEKNHGITPVSKIKSSRFFTGKEFDYPMMLTKALTMKMARRGGVINMFEIFPEIIAQFLITGKVTLDPSYPALKKLESKLNQAVMMLLKSVEGKVLVEV